MVTVACSCGVRPGDGEHAVAVDPEIKRSVLTRLRRIEGQVRGLQKMVEEERYCADVLTQVTSVQEALRGVGRAMLHNHLRHCATEAIRSGDDQTNALLLTAGFDQLVKSWATFAMDLISEWQMGDEQLELPAPVTFAQPFQRTIYPSNIPDRRDDLLNASIGAKLATRSGITFIVNALLPLNRGGLRASTLWTAGLEYGF